MKINYNSIKVKNNYENHIWMTKSFGKDVWKQFTKFTKAVDASEDLAFLKRTFKGLRVEKINDVFSARLNKQFRVLFCIQDLIINTIIIQRITPHDKQYDKRR